MKTALVCIGSFIVGAVTIAALDRLYFPQSGYEFRQMKRGATEVLYRVNKASGEVQYVASSSDPEKIGPTPTWGDSDPIVVQAIANSDPEMAEWLRREIPKLNATK